MGYKRLGAIWAFAGADRLVDAIVDRVAALNDRGDKGRDIWRRINLSEVCG